MKKIILLALAVVVLLVFMTGCAKQQTSPAAGNTATESADINTGISGVGDLDSELDTSELDNLDQELADIESLFS